MVNTQSTDGGLQINPQPLETQVATLRASMAQITQTLQDIQARLNNGEGPSQRDTGGHNGGGYGRLTKVEFPKFDGEEVVSWIYKVNKFFVMDNTVENEQKMRLVSMHLFGKALNWHRYFMSKFGAVMTWSSKTEEIDRNLSKTIEIGRNVSKTEEIGENRHHRSKTVEMCRKRSKSVENGGNRLKTVENG
uniref:Retrotransposon gag domain-containing protein n=1 Tax=Tanacetum cinerariifolium TaxID=118510 RepID=A0A699HTU7_TANCI|nr:hypothetical protein [Tanacetum cinerariifolium]